jgi:Calx-beta domain/HYR domain
MLANAPFSTAIATNVAGPFIEGDLMGDWDGTEDDTADHSGKIIDSSSVATTNFFFTRVAVSEHTIANGFPENIFYHGDNLGNVYVSASTSLTQVAPTPNTFVINLPTVLNAFGNLNSNNKIVVTGLAVSPVCDLSSFAHVNGAFAPFNGLIGEILYVTYEDTGGGFRLLSNGQLVRSGLLAFPVADVTSPAPAPPGVVSPLNYPVQVGSSFGVEFSVFSNLAGVAVDDDGSVYVQQVDLAQFTGGNIVKITSQDDHTNQDRSLATSGFSTLTTLNPGVPGTPSQGQYGTASGPANQISRYTNYSGTSPIFGNVISLASGPGNVLYAAVARSLNPNDTPGDQATEGLFNTNATTLGALPSMIITFADATGSFDNCSAPNPGSPPACPGCAVSTTIGSTPAADGLADLIPGTSTTWRAFVLGNGPDNRAATGANSAIFGTPTNTLKLDLAVDYTIYSGLAVDEEASAYVISGGTPANVGANPSQGRGEILKFEDNRPGDRRADYIDFRGDLPPNPPNSGGNVGDGDSDRFDHIYYVAPLDINTVSPAGLAGLSRGFLRYTNRLAPNAISPGVGLGLIAGEVSTVAVATGGTGYTVGDTLTLTTGGTGATVSVTTVGGAGDVTGVTLLTAGSGYVDGTSATTGGTGTGATITITVLTNQSVQGDDDHAGPILFEALDPSHQVAGGDDQVFPFRGDDDDGAGNNGDNTIGSPGPLKGGFEFLFSNPLGDVFSVGAACGTGNGIWNGFFLNSNGNITFGAGDNDNTATNTEFRSGLPKIAGAWSDLNPSSRASGFAGTFPVQAVGFANINAFKIRYINVPEFGGESCATANPLGAGQTNTFSFTLYDDGTGVDENANQPLNPANPIGNNAVAFDLLEGSTDKRFVPVTTGAGTVPVGELPRPDGSGFFKFDYGHMDLLGADTNPVLTGFSIGHQNAANPTGLCELNLGAAALSADTGFGNIQGVTEVRWPSFIGAGTEPELHEFFHNGKHGSVDSGTGVITPTQTDFDLRFEGNGNATPANQVDQTDVNRDKVGFNGTTCQVPASPQVSIVLPNPFVTTLTTDPKSLINAYAPVTVNLLGTGFFANDASTVCQTPNTGDKANPEGVSPSSVPARVGMTITTTATAVFDTNGDGIPDLSVPAGSVTPVSRNLVTVTFPPLANASGTGMGSPFPFLAPGGLATFTSMVTFTKGDNEIFNLLAAGGFNRTASLSFDTGARAPVVVGSSPSSGDASVPQTLTITGFDFQYTASTNIPPQPVTNPPTPPFAPRTFNVNAVFAVQKDNPANVIQATTFNVLNSTTISATFNFSGAPPGTQFLIFAQNAAGRSRNAVTAPGGASPNGNEQGNLVVFTVPPTISCPANITTNAPLGVSSVVVNYPPPAVSTGATASCSPASGSSFNIGTTPVICTATDTVGNTATCSFTVTVIGTNAMHLSASNFNVTEGCSSAVVTVQRDNANGTSSVDIATSDGTASQRNKYEIASSTLTFNPGEVSKTFTVLVNEESFVEGSETVNLTLSNPQNGVLGGGTVIGTVTILDNDTVPPTSNVIDIPGTFVCEHYHDFLNREPDASGLAFWTGTITSCGADANCIATARVNASAAFFLSIEFQETGFDVLRVQRVAFAHRSNNAAARFPYTQYMHDAQQVGQGVVVLQPGYQAVLAANKLAYVTQIVTSPAFTTLFPTSLTGPSYVDQLFLSAGVTPTAQERTDAITAFGAGGTAGRAAALQSAADSNSLRQAEVQPAFVLMEYYGYLRRNPTDPPDGNDNGYQFWLAKLNSFGGDAVKAEMVKAFLTSSEYRSRFGP